MDSLFTALINQSGFSRKRSLAPLICDNPLLEILSMIFFMPYTWRKFCLTASRIQSNIFLNQTLQQLYYEIVNTGEEILLPVVFRVRESHKKDRLQPINIIHVAELINEIITSPVQASVLSYFTRAELSAYPEQFIEAGEQSKLKEARATQLPDRVQQLDYTCLFTSGEMGFVGIHPDIPTFGIPGAVPTRLIKAFQNGSTV
jgi:hypothetical protein